MLGAVGNGAAHLAYSRSISTWFERRLGTALALVMLGAGLGATILPLIAQALVNAFGWRTAYASLGTQHYFWARRSACATYGTEKLSHSRIHNTPAQLCPDSRGSRAALVCFLDHCWDSVGQTMHTGSVESMSEINNEGKCMNSIDFWWPGTELNRRRQPFQGWILWA